MSERYLSPYDLAVQLAQPVLSGALTQGEAMAALLVDALRWEREGMGDAGEIMRAARFMFEDALGDEPLPPQPEYYYVPPPQERPTGPVIVKTEIHGELTESQIRGMNEERLRMDWAITGRFRPETRRVGP